MQDILTFKPGLFGGYLLIFSYRAAMDMKLGMNVILDEICQ